MSEFGKIVAIEFRWEDRKKVMDRTVVLTVGSARCNRRRPTGNIRNVSISVKWLVGRGWLLTGERTRRYNGGQMRFFRLPSCSDRRFGDDHRRISFRGPERLRVGSSSRNRRDRLVQRPDELRV